MHSSYNVVVSIDNKSVTAFNLGGLINLTQKIHLIFSVGHSLTNEYFTYNYLGMYGVDNRMIHGLGGINFLHFVFSPDETCFIYLQNNKTFLAENKLDLNSDRSTITNLLELSGSKHFFTSDGKYFLAIDGKILKSYFVDIEGIYNLTR